MAKRFVLPQGTFPRRPDLLSHHRLRRPLSKREIASSNLAKSTLFIFSFFCPSSSSSSKKKNSLEKTPRFFFAPTTQKRARAQKRGLALFGEEEELPGDPRPAAFLSSSSSSFGFSFSTKEEKAGSERARFFALTERDSIICSSTCRRKEDDARRWKDHHHLSKETVKVIRTNYGKS